jgi:hypothetical protein
MRVRTRDETTIDASRLHVAAKLRQPVFAIGAAAWGVKTLKHEKRSFLMRLNIVAS